MVKLDKPMDRQNTKYKKMQQNNLHGCILTRWKKKKNPDEKGSWMMLPSSQMLSSVHYSKQYIKARVAE